MITAYIIFAVALIALALWQYGRDQKRRQREWSERRDWALTPRPTSAPRKGVLR